jgi:phytoene dehydrogenase-like protein
MENAQGQVVVVGGGLAGLCAAAYLARAGRPVHVFEKAQEIGGRARTLRKNEYSFNQGPHALHRAGKGMEVLRELGIEPAGRSPSASGAYAVAGGVLHTLPVGLLSLLTTGLFRLPAKLEAARLLATIRRIDAEPLQATPLSEWLARSVKHGELRALIAALCRLATYAEDPERQSAGAALAQLQSALAANVLYLDGGWQVLVDALRQAALEAGARVSTGRRVASVEIEGRAVAGVRFEDGGRIPCAAVIIAAGPEAAADLVPGAAGEPLRAWAQSAVPVRAACLDVALSALPRPRGLFALGIDRPLYLSVHSASARLAPEGGHLVQLAKYLGAEGSDPAADEAELEGLLDLVQPGWREAVVHRRFLPQMVVSNALVTAEGGGIAGRPGPALPGVSSLFVAGDWVGPDGMLADAALASARQAAIEVAGCAPARAAA